MSELKINPEEIRFFVEPMGDIDALVMTYKTDGGRVFRNSKGMGRRVEQVSNQYLRFFLINQIKWLLNKLD